MDDGFHKHRKRIRTGLDLEGLAAIGLWAVAGSWASDDLTDGWVPDDVVDYLAPGLREALTPRLERSGLWERVTRDGEEGWRFHQWTDHQPSREQVLKERAAAAARQQRARDRAKAKTQNQGENTQAGGASRRDADVTHADSHTDVAPAVTVPPTRPDPTELPTEVPSSPPPATTAEPKTTKPSKRTAAKATTAEALFPTAPGTDVAVPDKVTARDVTAAWIDAITDAGGDPPTSGAIGKFSRDAKRLIEKENVPPEKLIEAAKEMAVGGWVSLDMQLHRLSAQRVQSDRVWQGRQSGGLAGSNPSRSPADARMSDAVALAAKYAELDRGAA
ncbi:hypothetical protein [Micromonospora pisi]|nr:hypothetical protein [Micromonospora pisi]